MERPRGRGVRKTGTQSEDVMRSESIVAEGRELAAKKAAIVLQSTRTVKTDTGDEERIPRPTGEYC